MIIDGFAAYVKQLWKNKPDTSTPLSADRLSHIESGVKGNSDAIEELAAAVVSQIVNDPDKIASMAAVYAVNQKAENAITKIGDTSKLPGGAADVVAAITQQNSNLDKLEKDLALKSDLGTCPMSICDLNNPPKYHVFIAKAGSTNLPDLGVNAVMCFQLLTGNQLYSALLCFGFGSDKIAIKRKSNSTTWTNWAYVTLS